MRRQQVLKYRLCDRYVTGCDRFTKKAVTLESQYLCGFRTLRDRCDSFFKVVRFLKKY